MNLGVSLALRTGLVEIWSHKTRSFLSFAAIAFGVAAILYTFAIVNESLKKQKEAFDLVGPGPIQITFMQWRKDDDKSLRLSRGLTSEDAEAMRRALPWLHMISPTLDRWGEVSYNNRKVWTGALGITPEWRKRNWVFTLRGRFFNSYDYEAGSPVCLLVEPGGWAKGKPPNERRWSYYDDEYSIDKLVTHNNMLGKDIALNNKVLTVVGILKEPPKDKDPRWFRSERSRVQIIIPLKTAQRYLNQKWWGDSNITDRVTTVDIDTGSLGSVPTVTRRLETLLNVLHRGEKDYQLVDLRQEIQRKVNEMREHAYTILSLGLIAILAGGVGIMNVTLATVFSRIREIGVRRAVGATRFDILMQFVIEAMLLGLLGGVAGILMGYGGLLFIAEEGLEKLESLMWWHVLATMGISLGASLLFSFYPAFQASRLDPVEALRYE